MKNDNQIQQGDVLLRRIAKLPETAKKEKAKGVITLQSSYVSGHSHSIQDSQGKCSLFSDGEKKFVVVDGETVYLTHEEHETIFMEPGIWEVGNVREFDHLEQMARQVID